MSDRKFSLIAKPNSIPYTDKDGNFSESWQEKFGGISSGLALQVEVTYNNELEAGVAVVIDGTTKTTKANGLATFTGLNKGSKTIQVTKSGFAGIIETKQIVNPFEFEEFTLTPLTITFTVKDSQNEGLQNATVVFNDETKQTDANGQVTFSHVEVGTKPYTITLAGYTTIEGTVTVEYTNQTINLTMTASMLVGKSAGTYTAGDTVKLNAGMGENDYVWTAYPSDTASVNTLTIEGEVGEVYDDKLKLTSAPTAETATISVVADQDDAEIDYVGGDEINEVLFNVVAMDKFIAFTQSDKTMYFKNNTLPYINIVGKTYENLTITYYTYENGAMVSHTATTSSQTASNTYDGTNLNINTNPYDDYVDGAWVRSTDDDMEIDNGDATITTSSYLTQVAPFIPSDTFKFALEKLNPEQFESKLVIGGIEKRFLNLQEFWVKSNQLIEIYTKKTNSEGMKDIFCKYLYITQDRVFKKVNFIISLNTGGVTIKFTVNNNEFTYTGNTANIDVFEGDTVYWEVSKEGYTSQSGSYTVANFPTIKTYTQTVELVSE